MSTTVSLPTLGAARRDQLDRIVEAGLVSQGRVFALSLEPVRLSLGDRWPQKREQIWDAAERALEKRLPPPDVFLRVDDTTFLAAVASANPYEAQVRCAEVLRSLLSFFLGRSADDDVVLTRVAALNGQALLCERVDLFAPPVPPVVVEGDIVARPRVPEDWIPPLGGRRTSTAIHTDGDKPVTVDFEVVPIWRLDRGIISAYRINRAWRGQRPPTTAQAEAVDQATLEVLLPILEEYRREGGIFAVIAPLNFGVVMPARPRLGLISRWAEAADLMRQVVILEIEGVDTGVPEGRVGETAALLAPCFHGVILKVSDQKVASNTLGEYAFNGVTIDPARLSNRNGLGGLICAVRRFTRNVLLLNAPSGLTDAVLKMAGVSHVTRTDLEAGPDLQAGGAGSGVEGTSGRGMNS